MATKRKKQLEIFVAVVGNIPDVEALHGGSYAEGLRESRS